MSVLQAVGVCDLCITPSWGLRHSTRPAWLVARALGGWSIASSRILEVFTSPPVQSPFVESALTLSSLSGTHMSRVSAQAGPLLARAARACEFENGTSLPMQMQCVPGHAAWNVEPGPVFRPLSSRSQAIRVHPWLSLFTPSERNLVFTVHLLCARLYRRHWGTPFTSVKGRIR